MIEKQYTDKNELICWHWDHAKERSIKGKNLLRAFYVTKKSEESVAVRIPVRFKLVLKTVLTCLIKTRKVERKSPITKNEMILEMIQQCIHNQLKFKYILADSWFASTNNRHFINEKKKVFIFDLQDNRLALQAFTDEDSLETRVSFLVSNDFSLTYDDFVAIYKRRWSVEEYHKSLKQNVGIAKSPTHRVKTQTNHVYCAIQAYIKLEEIKDMKNKTLKLA